METRDHSDLERLQVFLESIESASAISEPAAKMNSLFQVLYNFALRYLELQIQSSAEQTEVQLAALGLPRARTWTTTQQQRQTLESHQGIHADPSQESNALGDDDEFQWAVNPMFWMGNGAELENWFYDNQSSMEGLQDMTTGSTSMM